MKDAIFVALVGDIIGEDLAREIVAEPIRNEKTGMVETRYAVAYARILAMADASLEASDQETIRGNIDEGVRQFKDYFALIECTKYMEMKFKLL